MRKKKQPGRLVPHHGSGPDNYAPDHTAGRALAHGQANTLAQFSMNLSRVSRCECGGTVRGVHEFGRLFTYCEKCTPVVRMKCST